MAISRPRLVFMGTPDLARTVLEAVAADPRFEVVLVVAQPDKPVGRGLNVQAPPVKVAALERGLPVVQPARARDPQFIQQLRDLAPDLILVAAYGQILPPDLLAIPPQGCLNVHTSLLPRWRGAAPIQWAILSGDSITGVTLMRMDAGLDTGAIITKVATPIADTDTSQTLHDRLARLGGELVLSTLPDWMSGKIAADPQPADGVTLARKLTREDGRLEWNRTAIELHRQIRAFDPWPGAHTTMVGGAGKGELLKVWSAAPCASNGAPGIVLEAGPDGLVVGTAAGGLRLLEVQREGRKRMAARDFLAGGGLRVGDVLGAPAPAA